MENYTRQTVTPSITVSDGDSAIAFYEKVFGAKRLGHIMRGPDGKGIMHAELQFGDMRIFLNNELPAMGAFGPNHFGGTSVALMLYVPDVDKTYADAIAAGATSMMPPQDQFWGDRYAHVQDPFGHRWGIATPKENLTPDQIKERSENFWKEQGKC